ncbi:phenylacetate--CoA ligase family protein [Weeksella virosa]|uniref:Phenylacetate--CoA ligase n=1 Tax=Weeksella virosa (strain ATCC 43766 / DSM 16922 / JCM 21250 / CCUG 30538 / CDC 9751 / IAM 14551 / NBRC 16016 / NCTC 11634 / CL345/78) TaxID=865938 RepID=F0NZ58_WEEVC|nr:AMP-binding protein [Weeksella virosa]ADX68275.1 Phenylacetate--CoA ligase [Weeksella virosa DSM 16922]MDK7374619.1 AMP-binding protein [Weeksella virosa]SUP54588.1 Phenylacetate-coenzyme A ligase [Weeksella virosa]VEH64088.1 Phenylacetate-coenzyme A ligase [Weeksella virosa]
MIPLIETKSSEEILLYQEEKLREHLAYLAEKSPYYQRLFKQHSIDWTTLKSLKDLSKIPTTKKEDLYTNNDDFFCVPTQEIVDFATTSGTLGDPVTFGLTDEDLDRLAYNEMISFQCASIQKGDRVQLMTTMDRRFMAGLAYFLGLRKMGASVIRVGAGIPQLQWDSILLYKPKYLISVPSFLLKMIEFAEQNNIDYRNSSVKGVICIGEALRNADLSPSLLHKKITEKWPLDLYSTYASTEMATAFTECEEKQGGHHHPELIICEILDDNLQEVAEGELGELVVTPLGVKGLPLLRYQTGDLVRKHSAKCSCGRNTYRIGPVEGRKQQMIKYKGTTLYPPIMHDLLSSFDEIKLHLIVLSHTDVGTDNLVIQIVSENTTDEFLHQVKDTFRAKLRVAPDVVFVSADEILPVVHNPLKRKPTFFIDQRN